MRLRDLRIYLAATPLSATSAASGAGFVVGEVEGLMDLTVSYGALYRLDDADEDLVAIAALIVGHIPSAAPVEQCDALALTAW